MNNSTNNPFEDKKIHQTVNYPHHDPPEDRAPFNDAIKHEDIVNGFQTPKKIEQIPKWFKNPLRVFTIITLLIILSTLLYQVIQFIIAVASE
ncbi:hypothetical protein [Neobacillus terrae]|uniref:hypothetical protein n=1 Tax=Neobacillus terrae TaxID=3034837 RepID=UPI00140E66AE|nr:hypothetical protein [Neobacillus terrae]NHM31955.1 hypothetical protein [Neobacillus terrae]